MRNRNEFSVQLYQVPAEPSRDNPIKLVGSFLIRRGRQAAPIGDFPRRQALRLARALRKHFAFTDSELTCE